MISSKPYVVGTYLSHLEENDIMHAYDIGCDVYFEITILVHIWCSALSPQMKFIL